MDSAAMESTAPIAMPSEAPTLLWTVVLAAVALWWLWPWLDRCLRMLRANPPGAAVARARSRDAPEEDETIEMSATLPADDCAAMVEQCLEEPMFLPTVDLGFEPDAEFHETFVEAARLVAQVLDVAPLSNEYSKATSVLYRIADVLDRLFQAWSSPEELARVAQLRESSDAFVKNFGGRDQIGVGARGLLTAAGFERQEISAGDSPGGRGAGAVWSFGYEDARARLNAMSVRLCLKKVADLQRLRGSLRWVQASNSSVVPKASDARLTELLTLYRMEKSLIPLLADPSARERNVEAALRAKLNERREAADCRLPLLYHEGLTVAARSLVYAQRLHVRTKGGDIRPSKPLDSEVQAVLSRVPLPPGFDAAHLHFTSDELPHVFGLTSTRGGAGGGDDDTDSAADLLAREAVGFWAARQQGDVVWPYAALCGVGAALDYTVNRGFMVMFLVGYEGLLPDDEGSSEQINREIRRRRSGNTASSLPQSSRSFGARVQTLDSGMVKGLQHAK